MVPLPPTSGGRQVIRGVVSFPIHEEERFKKSHSFPHGLHEGDQGRQEYYHEDGGENAEYQGENHFYRGLHGLGSGSLAAQVPHVVGLDDQGVRHGSAQALGLHYRHDEEVYVLHVAAFRHELHGAAAGHAHSGIPEHAAEFVNQGAFHPFHYFTHGTVQRKAGLDGNGKEVKHVRQLADDQVLSLSDDMVKYAKGKEGAEEEAAPHHAEAMEGVHGLCVV